VKKICKCAEEAKSKQGRSQPNTAGGGGKTISGGGQIFIIFFKFEVKNRCKSIEEAKA